MLKKVNNSSNHIKYHLLNKYIYEKIDWIGKRLVFSEKRKEIDEIKQRDITATNYQEIKFSLMFKRMDIYLKIYFRKRKFFEATYVKGIGKSYIKILYFTAKNNVKTQFINSFLKFEIIPQNKKNKLLKFIISDCDFEHFFQKKLSFVNGREFLMFLNKNIINSLELFKTSLYSKLKIPFEYKKLFCLGNIFKPIEYEEKKIKRFLEKKCEVFIVVHQITCKINNYFAIVTIKENKLLNNFQISFYFQNSCRYFTSYISKKDLSKLDPRYIGQMFPFNYHLLRRTKYPNFFTFHQDFIKTRVEKLESNMNVLNLLLSNSDEEKNNAFLEKCFWERLLLASQLAFTTKNQMILIMNRSQLVLREELFSANILHKNENILLEITFKNSRNVKKPYFCYKNITYKKSKKFKVLFKISNLNSIESHSQAFSVRDLIYSKIKREKKKEKLEGIIFQQHELQKLAYYWANDFEKIVILPKQPHNFYSFDNKIFVADNKILKNKIHINSKFKYHQDPDFLRGKNENYLIYKKVLTIKPLQTFSLLYNPRENYFWSYLFIHSKCLYVKKKIGFIECEELVPNLRYLIGLRNFHKIGERLFINCKNIFIIKLNIFLNSFINS